MLQKLCKTHFLIAFLVSLVLNPVFFYLYRDSGNFVLNCNYQISLIISLVFLCLVIYLGFKSKDHIESIGFGILVGGGIWNLIQRVGGSCAYDYFKIGSTYTLRFNISDVLIWTGLTTLVVVCIKTLLSIKSIDVKR